MNRRPTELLLLIAFTLIFIFAPGFKFSEASKVYADSNSELTLITVPADPNDLNQPHYTYNGHLTAFRAVMQGADPNAQVYYRWDINGDGAWDQLEGKAYTNPYGKWYLGKASDLSGKGYLPNTSAERKLTIAVVEAATGISSMGVPTNSVFASYPVLQYRDLAPLQPAGLSNEGRAVLSNIAMEDALWYLHQNFVSVGASGSGATGYMPGSTNDARVANTALYMLALAENGHRGAYPAGADLFSSADRNEINDELYHHDPYAEDMARAANYLLNNLAEIQVLDLDKSDDGVQRLDGGISYSGLYIPYNSVPEISCGSLALAALAKSGLAGSTVAASSNLVQGLSFELIVQRMVDAGIAAQIDENSSQEAQGGWTYYPINNNQVVSPGAVNPFISGNWIYALELAEEQMSASGVYVNNRLKDRLANHLFYAINTDGGCKYNAGTSFSVFAPVGNYLLACQWLGWDQWDPADDSSAGYASNAMTKGQARQIYDMYLQYVIDHWQTPFNTSSPYGAYLWINGVYDSAVYANCQAGISNSNLSAKSLYGIKKFAQSGYTPTNLIGTNDWQQQFAVSLILGQHSSGYYLENNMSLEQLNLGYPGTTAYAAMAGGALYPDTITDVCITTENLEDATAGLGYHAVLTAEGGLPEQYRWQISGLPNGLGYSQYTGEIDGIPQSAGSYTINASVTDGISEDSATFSLVVLPGEVTMITESIPDFIAGEDNTFTLEAIGGLHPYTWQGWDLPQGLTLDEEKGIISGTPIVTGEFEIAIRVEDSKGSVANKTLFMNVNAYRPLRIITADLPVAYTTSAYSTMLQAEKGRAPYTWSASRLPQGLNMNSSSGEISGIPETEGTYSVSVSVQDSLRSETLVDLELNVRSVHITTEKLPDGYYGETAQRYTASLDVEGGGEPYSWSCTAYLESDPSEPASLPSGIEFDRSIGLLEGEILPGSTPQNMVLDISVTDAAGKFDAKRLALNFYPDFAHIVTDSIPNGLVGEPYTVALEAKNAYQATSFVWSAEKFPDGLRMDDSTGIISGIPEATGEYRARVTVHLPNDSRYVSQLYLFHILDPLTIDTESLPPGMLSEAYCYQLSATGGMTVWDDEVTWSADGLPKGLNLNEESGVIYGLSSDTGVYPVSVSVIDSDGNQAEKSLTLVIGPLEPPVLQSASVAENGTVVSLGFDKDMAAPVSGSAGFKVFFSITDKVVSSAQLDSADSKKIRLTLQTSIKGGEDLWLSYTPGSVAAADGGLLAAIGYYSFVNPLPHPILATTTPPGGAVNIPYTHTFTAEGGQTPYTFSGGEGLPPGLTLNPSSGVLSGTPDTAGTFNFGITVVDCNAAIDGRNYTIAINEPPDSSPVADAGGPYTIDAGQSLQLDGSDSYDPDEAVGDSIVSYEWDLDWDGAYDDAAGVNPVISFNQLYTLLNLGSFSEPADYFDIGLKVTDTTGRTGTAQTTLTINPIIDHNPVAMGTASPTTVNEGALGPGNGVVTFSHDGSYHPDAYHYIVDYQWIFDVPDPQNIYWGSYAWSNIQNGHYSADGKAWRSSDANAHPGYTYWRSGNYHAALRVVDDRSPSKTDVMVFNITVNPTLSITTATLPQGTVGVSYNTTLSVNDGTAPYAWFASGMPAGLGLLNANGEITGTPLAAGTSTVSIEVMDSNGRTSGLKTFTLTINEANPPAKPTGLTADELSFANVTLTWDALLDIDSYKVYRATAEEGPYTELGTSDQNSYTDNGVTPGTTYWYKVSAVKNGEESPLSDAVSVTTLSLALIQLESSSYDVSEEEGSITIHVTRSGNVSSTVEVDYVPEDGLALLGEDYIAAFGTLIFEPNEVNKTITIALVDDDTYEPKETFSLSLFNPSAEAQLGENSQAAITIGENDYMESTGTVQFFNLEGGFYGILGDDGQKYRPVNQPNNVQAGDKVSFKWIPVKGAVGFQMWGKPIRLLSIEELLL